MDKQLDNDIMVDDSDDFYHCNTGVCQIFALLGWLMFSYVSADDNIRWHHVAS